MTPITARNRVARTAHATGTAPSAHSPMVLERPISAVTSSNGTNTRLKFHDVAVTKGTLFALSAVKGSFPSLTGQHASPLACARLPCTAAISPEISTTLIATERGCAS